VSGTKDVGGLVGKNTNGGSLGLSYYDKDKSGTTGAVGTGGGGGYDFTTDEMKNILTYMRYFQNVSNWDFNSTWAIVPFLNDGYPVLQYQLKDMQLIAKSKAYLANQRQKNDTIPTTIELHTGNPIEPQVDSVVFNTNKLVKERDYDVFYYNNTAIGTTNYYGFAKIIIQGKGNYYGTKVLDFYITDFRNIADATVAPILSQFATGSPIMYKPVVKDYNDVTLRENIDYILGYSNNISVGIAKITIIGQGIYDGSSKEVTFNIVNAKPLTSGTSGNTTVSIVGPQSYVYSGSKITPEVTVLYKTENITLVKDQDYTVSYGSNTNVGNGTVTITGIGNYTGTISQNFSITAKPLATSMVAPVPPQQFTGTAVEPEVTLTDGEKNLVLGTDYRVSYLSNEYINEQAIIRITGTGNYSGTITVLFAITEDEIEKIPVTVIWQGPFDFEYNGQPRCPAATATLPINLSISCTGAINARTDPPYIATATYPNTAYELLNNTITFTISRAPITATLEIPNINKGAALKPAVKGYKENPSINYWYSKNRDSDYTQTAPTNEGIYYAYAIVSPTSNYNGSATDTISFSIYESAPTQISVIWSGPYSVVYNGEKQSPGASASTIGGISFPLLVNGATDAGTHAATAKFKDERTDYRLANDTIVFTITPKPLDEYAIEPIGNFFYNGFQIRPSIIVKDGGKVLAEGIDYEVEYAANITELGTVIVIGKGNYKDTISRHFPIISEDAAVVTVEWSTERTFTYDGTEHAPAATASNLEIEIIGKQTNAGSYTAVAQLKTPNPSIMLANASMPYTIAKKPLAVSWTPEREFVYNKMVQVPIPSVEETNVVLRVLNGHSAAGVYEGVLAPFAQIVSSNAGNYELSGHTIDKYEIKQKPLQSRFSVKAPADDFDANADTVWVPRDIFSDPALLKSTLESIIDYDGFATDDKGDSDDASVLRGTPTITLQYDAQTSPFILSKRVETSQRATATILTDDVSADNYVLIRRNMVVMEAITEADNAPQISCKKNASCASMSENSCGIIGGEVVATCTMFCMIEDACAPMPLSSCTAMGGSPVETCEGSPIQRPQLSSGTFRIWQAASGVVNVDLGYMPTAPMSLNVYDLKGNLVATEQVNTRFANVRVGVPSGVYLFKVGNRVLRAAVL